ncbi:MAG: hypothetical protein RLZZ618_2939 [Pseudomonadota bacterium]|jgi:predicted MPP superfamily phosphohydrolase
MPLLMLSALLHALVGWRLLPALSATPWAAALLSGVLVVSAVLLPQGLRPPRWSSRGAVALLSWSGYLFMGFFSTLFVLTLLRDAGGAVLWVASWAWPGVDSATADAARWTAQAVPLAAAAVTLWGLVNARRTAAVVSVDVPITNLPAGLHGFTIAQITDVHVGQTIRRGYLEAIVRKVNALQADLVAVTGDLVDGSVRELGVHVAPLSQLVSTHGTYFVTGNHEYYSGAVSWITELRRLGLTVLMNEHVVLGPPAAQLVLAGVADHGAHHFEPSHRSDPQGALAGAPSGASVRVLLAHQPRTAEAAEQAGFDLQVSGHTHGGQFWPWNFFVPLQQPFTAGLHRLRRLWVYTSRGTGYWGPPKRLGAPSEITRLRLVAA